jgi:hypothetical protein
MLVVINPFALVIIYIVRFKKRGRIVEVSLGPNHQEIKWI